MNISATANTILCKNCQKPCKGSRGLATHSRFCKVPSRATVHREDIHEPIVSIHTDSIEIAPQEAQEAQSFDIQEDIAIVPQNSPIVRERKSFQQAIVEAVVQETVAEESKSIRKSTSKGDLWTHDNVESMLLQNPMFLQDISDLQWTKGHSGILETKDRFEGRPLFCDNFCVRFVHTKDQLTRSDGGKKVLSATSMQIDRDRIIIALIRIYGPVLRFDIKTLETSPQKDGTEHTKYKVAMCHVPLRVQDIAALFRAIIEEGQGRAYIEDIDLTHDLSGHLDYEAFVNDLPKDLRWTHTPTPRCGSQMCQFRTQHGDRLKYYSKLVSNIEVGSGRSVFGSQFCYNIQNPQPMLRETMHRLADVGYTRLEWTTTFSEEQRSNPEILEHIVQDLIANRAAQYTEVFMQYPKVYILPDTRLIKNYLEAIKQAILVETQDSFYVAWSRNQMSGRVQGRLYAKPP